MKKYVIFVDWGSEGWKIHSETDDFAEAVKLREEGLRFGRNTFIFKPVLLEVREVEE